jgi:hypothetical protein
LIFGQPAGVIMGETQALIAIATGLSPLALFFIPANGLGSLAYSLVARGLTMEKWSHHLAAQILCNVVGNLCVCIGLLTILHLPLLVAVISSSITAAASIAGSTILTKLLADALRKSGLI